MTDRPPPSALDAETLAYVQAVFDLVRAGDAERLGDLLRRGLPANLCNQKGDSLLMLAAYHGHLEAARELLRHGADPEVRNDAGQTPILGAAFKGDVDMVKLLLANGADVESTMPDGKTTLMMAAMFGRDEIIDLLLSHGANLRVRDARGWSVVDAANVMGAASTAERLARALQEDAEAAEK